MPVVEKEVTQLVPQVDKEFTNVKSVTKTQGAATSQIPLHNGFGVLADEDDLVTGIVNDQEVRQIEEAEGGSPSKKDG